jgi:hypothetical protein
MKDGEVKATFEDEEEERETLHVRIKMGRRFLEDCKKSETIREKAVSIVTGDVMTLVRKKLEEGPP